MRRRFILILTSSAIITVLMILSQHEWESFPEQDLENASSPNIENLPNYYFNNKNHPNQSTCAHLPKLFDIKFINDHWQTQKISNGTFHLYSAYLDNRFSTWMVRIIGMFNQRYPNQTFYCQIWSNSVEVAPTTELVRIFRKQWKEADRKGLFQPYIITCPISKHYIPLSVSLVEKPCQYATNNLKVNYRKKFKWWRKKNFVVCVKGLSYPNLDRSIRLVEWIELIFILGADKIVFYSFKNHPKIEQVLRYYLKSGKIEVIPITLIGSFSNHPYLQNKYLYEKRTERRLQEVIPYNDCFYRNFQEYKYVVLLDIDEVIVPSSGTWTGLIKKLPYWYKDSYMAQNVYFFDNYNVKFGGIPTYMHMLQTVYRTRNYTKKTKNRKGFHDTSQIIALHNHYPIDCLKKCHYSNIDPSLAHLQHYRNDCISSVKNCKLMKKDMVMDTRIWNYKDELIEKVDKALKNLTENN